MLSLLQEILPKFLWYQIFSSIVCSILFLPLLQSPSFSCLCILRNTSVSKMNLYSHRFDAVCIKRLKCVNQCHRNDRTFCLCCRFEASSFESPRFISLFRSCSLRKNQVISSTFHFICHIDDDLHGLPDILPVNHVRLHAGKDLFQKRNIGNFLFATTEKEPGMPQALPAHRKAPDGLGKT